MKVTIKTEKNRHPTIEMMGESIIDAFAIAKLANDAKVTGITFNVIDDDNIFGGVSIQVPLPSVIDLVKL